MEDRTREATSELKSRSRRVIEEVLNRNDPDAVTELSDEDLVVHGLCAGTDSKGVDAFREELTAWREAVPDSEDHIDDIVTEGDTVVLFCTRRGTQEREYLGIPAAAIGSPSRYQLSTSSASRTVRLSNGDARQRPRDGPATRCPPGFTGKLVRLDRAVQTLAYRLSA